MSKAAVLCHLGILRHGAPSPHDGIAAVACWTNACIGLTQWGLGKLCPKVCCKWSSALVARHVPQPLRSVQPEASYHTGIRPASFIHYDVDNATLWVGSSYTQRPSVTKTTQRQEDEGPSEEDLLNSDKCYNVDRSACATLRAVLPQDAHMSTVQSGG